MRLKPLLWRGVNKLVTLLVLAIVAAAVWMIFSFMHNPNSCGEGGPVGTESDNPACDEGAVP